MKYENTSSATWVLQPVKQLRVVVRCWREPVQRWSEQHFSWEHQANDFAD
ncbi:hypothetical protein [Pararobbsia alpina]|nr:hypothetical protein [Pararobbsia alpina]